MYSCWKDEKVGVHDCASYSPTIAWDSPDSVYCGLDSCKHADIRSSISPAFPALWPTAVSDAFSIIIKVRLKA